MPGFNIAQTITVADINGNLRVVPVNDCDDKNAFSIGAAFEGPNNLSETARRHRFRLEFLEPLGYGGGTTGILLFMEKCTRPTPEVDEITIHNGQDEIYRPGKQRWSPVEFTFYEKVRSTNNFAVQTNEAAELIYQWWGRTMIALTQSKHGQVFDYYKNAQLQMLDGVGNPIWTYFLYDCWPQKVTPIELSYSDTDIATITVTLRFNKAEERRIKKN